MDDQQGVEAKTESGTLHLPDAPEDLSGPVKAWEEDVEILTYLPAEPDPNPMFLEKRVYQGSSGRVYPLPFIDRIDTEPQKKMWKAFHIENEYLRLMILPEIGGRIHIGYDKVTGYDFFYRQDVIKPALVGLAGPWVSGGVEFNGHSIIDQLPLCRSQQRSRRTLTDQSRSGAAIMIRCFG